MDEYGLGHPIIWSDRDYGALRLMFGNLLSCEAAMSEHNDQAGFDIE